MYMAFLAFFYRYLEFVRMRRSGAPSQKAGGLPPLKRTKFSTPFMSGSDHFHQTALEAPSLENEDHGVSMLRICHRLDSGCEL